MISIKDAVLSTLAAAGIGGAFTNSMATGERMASVEARAEGLEKRVDSIESLIKKTHELTITSSESIEWIKVAVDDVKRGQHHH